MATRRITSGGEARRVPDDWEYELVATHYPIDNSVVFLAKISLRDRPSFAVPPLAAERGMPSRIAGVASRGFRWLARGRACAS